MFLAAAANPMVLVPALPVPLSQYIERSAFTSMSLETAIDVSVLGTFLLTLMLWRVLAPIVMVGCFTGPWEVMNVTSTLAALLLGFCSSSQVWKPQALDPSERYHVLLGADTPIEAAPPRRPSQYIARSQTMFWSLTSLVDTSHCPTSLETSRVLRWPAATVIVGLVTTPWEVM